MVGLLLGLLDAFAISTLSTPLSMLTVTLPVAPPAKINVELLRVKVPDVTSPVMITVSLVNVPPVLPLRVTGGSPAPVAPVPP